MLPWIRLEILGPWPPGQGSALAVALRVNIKFLVRSALTLFVTQVFANHHDAAVATNHFALVADLLDARLYFHGTSSTTCSGRRSDLG